MEKAENDPLPTGAPPAQAGFTLRFLNAVDASGRAVWQTHLRHHQSGAEVLLPGRDPEHWARWIRERVLRPSPPTGGNDMSQQVIEMSVGDTDVRSGKKEALQELYYKDMAAQTDDGDAAVPGGGLAPGPEAVGERPPADSYATVSNSVGAHLLADGSKAGAFGERGRPRGPNQLEVVAALDGGEEDYASLEAVMDGVDESLLLDAWHGEYNTSTAMTMMRQEPVGNAMMNALEVVIGPDDRLRVTDGLTQNYPWRCICALRIVAGDNTPWIGTGWLVGPRTVITAGHCVYMHPRGGWVRSIKVVPGRDGAEQPSGECVATDFRSVRGWTRDRLRTHDYGAIILPEECRFGDDLGHFGYGAQEDGVLRRTTVNLSGYPGDKMPPGTQQWFHAREIQRLTPRTIVYQIDTAGGQSGAPVWWLMEDGRRIAVGIHTNGDIAGNSATRITADVAANIEAWADPDE